MPPGPVSAGAITLAQGSGTVSLQPADEFVVVADGTVSFTQGGQTLTLRPGESAVLRQGRGVLLGGARACLHTVHALPGQRWRRRRPRHRADRPGAAVGAIGRASRGTATHADSALPQSDRLPFGRRAIQLRDLGFDSLSSRRHALSPL
ncbi:cupin domain-containing protein [Burkholderia glumae]|uniref:cupin domain-containing protein n=1 Tax=Burkholderia glumae TaxID=337 RepID=UPI0030C69915